MGSYTCTCNSGYQGDGRNCAGKSKTSNEGIIATDADSFVLRALLIIWRFRARWPCSCRHIVFFDVHSSSSLFGVHFVPDIDECSSENECHVNATCTNTIGSYNCTCKKGYGGDGRNCSGKVQSNESIIATDPDSFVLRALLIIRRFRARWPCSRRHIVFFDVHSSSSLFGVHVVPDIDECSSENECHVNATCTNTIGSYNCTCKKGYGGDGRNCSGKVQSNESIIATDADSFVLHGLCAN